MLSASITLREKEDKKKKERENLYINIDTDR